MTDEGSKRWRLAPLTCLANRRWRVGLIAIVVIPVSALAIGVIYHATPNRNDVLHVVPNAPLSTTLASQTVYLPTDVGVYALRASDGALRWAYPADSGKTPIVHRQSVLGLALDGALLYVLAISTDTNQGQTTLTALNASNGAPRWSVSLPAMMRGSLVQVGSLLIVAALGPADLGAPPSAQKMHAACSVAPAMTSALLAATLRPQYQRIESVGDSAISCLLWTCQGRRMWSSEAERGAPGHPC